MSIKSVIVNAIMKVTVENPVKNQEGAPSFEQERAYFIELLLQELFPENPAMPVIPNEVSVTVPMVPTEAPAEAPAKVKKPRAKKEVPAVVETDSLAEAPAKVKKPRAKKEKASNAEAIIAEVNKVIPPVEAPVEAPVVEKKKPGPKPKVEKDKKALNVENTPTFAKMFKEISAELKVDANKKKTLDTINAMTSEEFNAEGKTLESHLRAILTPASAPVPIETQMKDLISVEFEGKEYAVDEETKTVYVLDYDGVGTRVGTMGVNDFKDMELPPLDE
jgi:Tfp pilus assembly protein FimV